MILLSLVLVGNACGTEQAEPTEVPAAVCAAGQIDGDLHLHLPAELLPPGVVPGFESRFGVDVTTTGFDSPDELIAQVEARVGDYDLVIADDETIRIMREGDLLTPLSVDAIPLRSNLMDVFDDPPYDPGSAHSVPFTWGTIGLGVNQNVAPNPVPATWGLIFDPVLGEAFAGRVSLIDDDRMALGAALKYLGRSLNASDEDALEEAVALLKETRVRIASYTSAEDAVDLVNGATDVAQAYSADVFDAFEANNAWDDYTYVVPAEGAPMTVELMAVPVTSERPCTAHTFMDFLLQPDYGAQIARWARAASPNTAATEILPEQLVNDVGLYPPPETMANLEFIGPAEDPATYVDAFERAKS